LIVCTLFDNLTANEDGTPCAHRASGLLSLLSVTATATDRGINWGDGQAFRR